MLIKVIKVGSPAVGRPQKLDGQCSAAEKDLPGLVFEV